MPPQSAALDRTILAHIADWRSGGAGPGDDQFNELACGLAEYQLFNNAPYRAYANSLGVTAGRPPRDWRDIPAVPASAFKDALLATCPPSAAALEFRTSGTSERRSGRHFIANASLYEESLLAGFSRAIVPDGARLRFLNLVPDPRERPHSSLGYMMAVVARELGDGNELWCIHDDRLELTALRRELERAVAEGVAVCLAATAFSLAGAVAEIDRPGKRFCLPAGSRIMETGGFKGRARAVSPELLYECAASAFGVPVSSIISEYGMTELCSQYYDTPESRQSAQRRKSGPPWLRTVVIDANGAQVPPGTVGTLRHVDLANRSSVIAIDTEDLGAATPGGLLLLGREQGAELRGCSLDAESLELHAAAPCAPR